MKALLTLALALTLFVSPDVAAAEQSAPTTHAAADSHAAHGPDAEPHPKVPHDPEWAGGLLMWIMILFIGAAVVGPIRSMFKREEPVVADMDHHSHSHEAHEHTSAGLDKHGAHDPHAGHGGAAHH